MIKYSNLYFPSRLVVIFSLDGLLLAFAIFLSFGRSHAASPLAVAPGLVSVAATLIFLACFYFFDLYDLDVTRRTRDLLLKCLRALGTGILLLAPVWALFVFTRPSYRELEINLVAFILIFCVYRTLTEWLHARIFPGERILLVGSGPSIQLLARTLEQRFCLPLRLTAIVPQSTSESPSDGSFSMCEDVTKIPQIMKSFRPQRIAFAGNLEPRSALAAELLELRRQGVRIEDAGALYTTITGRLPVALLDTRRMAFGRGFAASRAVYRLQGILGVALAAVALLVFSPLFVLLAILIKLDSRGPVFYKQERVGLNGKTFLTFKFRSMRTDAETASGPVWASTRDPRVTRVGRLLRTLRFDELPQLFNILRGDMALVGPRPERPHFVSMLGEEIQFYDLRHSVRPGITGWAQVSAGYGATVEESREKLEYDLFYIINRSIFLDTLIILKTVKIMICGKGAR
jgi:exopolysaccharide biosynthesis polyprenyl glycosylphosphotransferase